MLAFIRSLRGTANVSEARADLGGGQTIQADHFAPSGDDSYPLPTDYVVTLGVNGTGRVSAVGYVDPINTPVATAGDKRIYARDPVTGETVVAFWLKSTGEAVWSNGAGAITLQANGTINLNGVTISPAGAVTVPSSLTLDGKELADHTHGGVQSGGSNTGPNN